jgi:pyruvate dehydrogenase E2 component (dihydrolipoamide acetyltransferase)
VTVLVDMVMPFLSETMTEGTVGAWLKEIGGVVAVGDDLVEIETDKVTTVYQSDSAGILTEILVAAGTSVSTGTVIARIRSTS